MGLPNHTADWIERRKLTPRPILLRSRVAFSKKKKRRITVDGQEYEWVASGDDGWINLRVMVDIQGGQHLVCYFDYHQDRTRHEDGSVSLSCQFVVTSYIVRQTIEYGLAHGWRPLERGAELRLGHLDNKIDLRLNKNREEAFVKAEPPLDHGDARRRWFENYCAMLDNGSVFAEAKPGVRYRCPCCGFRTLDTRGGFDICPVCFWEDDGQDDHDADVVRGGPNGRMSLAAARENYADFGACERSALEHVREPTSEET